jgi:hypothetical protein
MPLYRTTNENTKNTWYALRRTLVPWDFERQLKDLLDSSDKFQIDEVIIVIDTEEFSHGHPSREWVDEYQKMLFTIRESLLENGIVYSLNPWITVGHNDRGRDMRARFPEMRMMVGHRGEKAKAQPCPMDPVWRNHIEYIWGKYAETRPHLIWVDDDIRTFNHEPVDYGCFCDEHLRMFNEKTGVNIGREELVDAIFREGPPHPWREEWLMLQREVMLDTLNFIRNTVQSISPETRMGLMSSGPENHVLDGRDWEKTCRIFSGNNPLYSRAPLGNYWEESLRGFYYTARQVRATRACIPENAVEQAEVENWWFSGYSKSISFTRAQIGISLLLGSDGLTLNLFDHLGGLLSDYMDFGNMLRESKPFFNGLTERCRGKAPCGGIRILHHDNSAMKKHLNSGNPGLNVPDAMVLAEDGHYWDSFLESLGFSTTWDTPENNSGITAVSGQVLRAFGDEEIKELLSEGLILDLSALEVLSERGFAEYTGVKLLEVKPRNSWKNLSAEEWNNPEYAGKSGCYLTMTLPFLASSPDIGEVISSGADVISRLVDIERNPISPFLTFYRNTLGGRIAVFPIRLGAEHGSLLNPLRKEQFSFLLDRLSEGKTALEVQPVDGVYPLPVSREWKDHTITAAYNLSLDTWNAVIFNLYSGNRILKRMEILNSRGEWEPFQADTVSTDGRLEIRVEKEIGSLTPLVLDLIWENDS